jgi:hypothetical protein
MYLANDPPDDRRSAQPPIGALAQDLASTPASMASPNSIFPLSLST